MVFVEMPNAGTNTQKISLSGLNPGESGKYSQQPGKWLSVTETTQAQWIIVMGDNPSSNKGNNLPVEMISWARAVEFCQRLSSKEGLVYRLPTEVEWERACLASPNKLATNNLKNVAWTLENSSKTQPVGMLSPNSLGIFDMQGNVAEWCLDTKVWKDDRGFVRDDLRIIKGGAFSYFAHDANPGSNMTYPGGAKESYRAGFIGFRVLVEKDSSQTVDTNIAKQK